MDLNSRIYVAGHGGMVGSAICRHLEERGHSKIIVRTMEEADLRDRGAAEGIFREERPEFAFLAAARVGGIHANRTYPAGFLYDNLAIELNIIDLARKYGVEKLLFLGSSCVYPRDCPQPMREEALLSGYLEKTNEPYAIAKIAGIKMCEYYRMEYGSRFVSIMPTNLYGPGDNFDLEDSHVIPALLRKFHEAVQGGVEEVEIWGTGKPRREFLHVDDLADAACFLMREFDDELFINVGVGQDISIGELARLVAEIAGFEGKLKFDESMPDGTPRKLLDVSRLSKLGWKARVGLKEGLTSTYEWYRENYPDVRGVNRSGTGD